MLASSAPAWLDRRAMRVLAVALPAIAILIVLSREFVTFFADDSFISLRYARRFLDGHGLTYSDGDRVEGYTNFLWVVLIAIGGVFSRDLVGVARFMGTLTMSLALLTIAAASLPRRGREMVPVAAVCIALAASGPIATWSVGGLETPLFCALVTLGLAFTYRLLETDGDRRRYCRLAGVAWALAAMTRPDGILFPFVAAGAVVATRRFRSSAFRDALHMLAIPVGTYAAHTLFRRAYYGDWVPNTYHAKMAISLHRMKEGLDYVATSREALFALLPPVLLAGFAAAMHPLRRRRVVLLTAVLVAWMAYVVAIGGDIMRHYRHVVPALFVLALLDAEGFTWLATRGGRSTILANVAGAAFVVFAVVQRENDPGRQEVLNERWEWSGQNVGLFLHRAFSEARPLLAVDAAGSTPYYSELDTLDMLGLNDRYLALHPPRDFGTGWMGHELGDGNYALRRKPDLVMFVIPPGWERPLAHGSLELYALPQFHRLYKPILFDTASKYHEHALLWVRVEDGRLGVHRSGADIVVPGFLLAGKDRPVARLVSGTLRTVFEPQDVGRVAFSVSEPGVYQLQAEATGSVTFRIDTPAGSVLGGTGVAIQIPKPHGRISVEARPAGPSAAQLAELRLVRAP